MGTVGYWVLLVVFPAAAMAGAAFQGAPSKSAPPPKPAAQVMPRGKASAPPIPAQKDESAEKRRERMKARDAEMDRVLKQKQDQSKGR